MNIYLAYRSGYIPNNRYLKKFEAKSVLDWFIDNWKFLIDEDQVENFFETYIYGFPLVDCDSDQPVPIPSNLKDLKEKLEHFVYSNEVIVKKNCVQVYTDDDEIELAWYVFNEEYVRLHPEKISIWFHDRLPVDFSLVPSAEKLKSIGFLPKGKEPVRTYYFSSCIYSSCNLEDLCIVPHRFDGVSLPNLIDFLRRSEYILTKDNSHVEVLLIQQLAKIFPHLSQKEIFEELTRHDLTAMTERKILVLTKEALDSFDYSHLDKNNKSLIHYSEHLIEVMIEGNPGMYGDGNSSNYNYLVLFDEYWLTNHHNLAHSIVQFHKSWKI